ncbi:MAG TPA: murein transglycosylase [Parvularcula sp.]|nr:murein transglycosylase [Parvularcula sp.]
MRTLTPLRVAVLSAGVAAVAAGAFWAGRRSAAPETAPPALELAGVSFSVSEFAALEGWKDRDPSAAIAAFARSCAVRAALDADAPANPFEALGREGATLGGAVTDWREACAAAAAFDAHAGAAAARAFFEAHFQPVALAARMAPGGDRAAPAVVEKKGRFTAYFEPYYRASAAQTPEFSAPVLARPPDLVTVDLGAFRADLAGERIAGAVVDGALAPYPDHAAINAGALDGRTEVIAFMRPADLLFLQIQGSGRLDLGDRVLSVGYDGHNGAKYVAIGKTLIEDGALTRDNVSMQTIRAWLDAAPEADARRVLESNPSYIFFRLMEDLPDPALGPLGAGGAQLAPMVSLAVDPRFTPLGAPVWVDLEGDEPFRRLMIAQDRGGAIKGPVRGDLYAGSGEEAGEFAGAFNRMGTMTVLLPRAVAGRLASGAP